MVVDVQSDSFSAEQGSTRNASRCDLVLTWMAITWTSFKLVNQPFKVNEL